MYEPQGQMDGKIPPKKHERSSQTKGVPWSREQRFGYPYFVVILVVVTQLNSPKRKQLMSLFFTLELLCLVPEIWLKYPTYFLCSTFI